MKQLLLHIHGLSVRVKTDNSLFYELVRDYYKLFISNSLNSINIDVLFSKGLCHSDVLADPNKVRFGDGIYITKTGLAWKNSFGFHCSLQIQNSNSWLISGYHDDLSKCSNGEETTKNLIRSMRWLIHFPLFEMLNRQKNIGVIHASAVANENTSLVFSGLNKVGKSSLARYFVEKLNYDYLSDNFLLHNEKTLFAFPEKARLSKDAIAYYDLEVNEPQIYDKYQVSIAENRVQKTCDLRNVYLINNGGSVCLKPISHEEYKTKIDAVHRYLKEFSEYEYLSFLDMFHPIIGKRNIATLNASANYFQLTIPLDWSLKDVVFEVNKCL